MALNPCVRSILCALSGAVLGAVSSVIDTQIAALTAQITALQSQLLVLDVATLPVELSRNIALSVLASARGVAQLVPVELVAGCLDLGEFNFDLVTSIDAATAEVNDLVDDLNRLLSYKAELAALVAEYEGIIEQFNEVKLVIQECAQA